MKREVGWPGFLVALIVVAGILYGMYRFTGVYFSPPAHPGASDIPPRRPEDSIPVTPPKDAGPVPGMINR